MSNTGSEISHNRTTLAIEDLGGGVANWRLWSFLGFYDIQQRYRRALLGPLWITLSMAIMVLALAFVYSSLFKTDLQGLLPFLSAGFTGWLYISSLISEGTQVFISSESYIKHGKIPMTLYVSRLVWRNILVMLHNCVVVAAVYVIFQLPLTWNILLIIPSLAMVTAILFCFVIVLGSMSARFRDFPPIVLSLLQLVFFVTPIMFRPDMLTGQASVFVHYNPFYYLIEALRAPLLGNAPAAEVWIGLSITLGVSLVVGFVVFRKVRGRIAYWL